MKKAYAFCAAISMAVSTVAVSSAAHAAPTIIYTTSTGGSFTAFFGDSPGKTSSFSDYFTSFTITTAGLLTGSLSTAGVYPSQSLNFTAADLLGPGGPYSFSITKSPLSASPGSKPYPYTNPTGLQTGSLGPITLGPGTYQLHITGSSGSIASLSGNLTFTAAPEPAAWALMILGFGAVGFIMRRQRNTGGERLVVSYS